MPALEEGLKEDSNPVKISRDEQIEECNLRLQKILEGQSRLDAEMLTLNRKMPDLLSKAQRDASDLLAKTTFTAEFAEQVSAKVRQMDEARSRVSECQQRVHDLIDLQLCSEGVIQAIREEDYEKGAAHVNRFLSMDKTLLRRTASDVSESMTSVSQAVATLENAAAQIRTVVSQKFEDAVKRDDLASLERFFKIFPLLGMHDEGIGKFFGYICGKLDGKAEKELRTTMDRAKADKRLPIAFADTLTIFLENFAKVVEVNQPLLETYYGFGHLVKAAAFLQRECDAEARKLVAEFKNNRQIGRKVMQINEFGKSQPAAAGHRKGASIDKLSAKDVDVLVNEIAIMHSRAELYIRFIKRRVKNDLESSNLSEDAKSKHQQDFDELIDNSGLRTQMQEMIGIYLTLEKFFMEESVLKAISLDSYEQGQQNSSMVDDVFFIIKKSIRRSIGTHSLDGVCAVINNSASCLEQDYLHALRTPLKAGYPSGYIDLAQAYNAFQTSIQQGRLQTSDVEQTRVNFITQLNNADKSLEFIETLWKMMGDEARTAFPAISPRESEILASCLAGLKAFSDSLRALIDFGLQQLRSSAVKPRLHPWVDQFLTHNHTLTEEEFAAYEAGETFVQYLIVQLDTLLNSFKSQLSEHNYEALVDIIATDTTARLERAIKKTAFNRIGGLILDQELRTLGSFLANSSSWTVRDKMTRLNQIATILNLEKLTDLSEIYNVESDIITWRLTQKEIRSFLILRTDFKVDEIKKLKF